jgi:hypothetical protein
MTEQPPPRPERPDDEDAAGSHTLANLVLLAFFVLIVGVGIWIVGVMLDARKLQDCVSSGRRNCMPIDVPIRNR